MKVLSSLSEMYSRLHVLVFQLVYKVFIRQETIGKAGEQNLDPQFILIRAPFHPRAATHIVLQLCVQLWNQSRPLPGILFHDLPLCLDRSLSRDDVLAGHDVPVDLAELVIAHGLSQRCDIRAVVPQQLLDSLFHDAFPFTVWWIGQASNSWVYLDSSAMTP